MDNLKLRVGYGVTGINVADPYTSLSSLNYNGAFLYNGTWVKALETIRNNNADLRWEKKHEFNVGLDWDVLGGRLGGTVDYYIRRTKMLFGTRGSCSALYVSNHASQCIGNGNKGLEILIRATPIQTENSLGIPMCPILLIQTRSLHYPARNSRWTKIISIQGIPENPFKPLPISSK